MIIFGQISTKTYTGTFEQLEAIYKKVLRHNLMLGWWSIPGFIYTIMALNRNIKNRKSLHDLVNPKTISA